MLTKITPGPQTLGDPAPVEPVIHHKPVGFSDRFALGLTLPEIATHLGISVKAVEKRMTQALKLCMARYRG